MSSASSLFRHLQWKYVTVTVAAKPTIVLVGNEYLSSQCAIIVGPKLCRAEWVAPAHFCSPIHPGGVLADQRTPTGCMANTSCGGAFDLHLDHSTNTHTHTHTHIYVHIRIICRANYTCTHVTIQCTVDLEIFFVKIFSWAALTTKIKNTK